MDVPLPRRRTASFRGGLWAAALLVLAAAVVVALQRGSELPRVERESLLTAKVQAGSFVVRVRGSGTLRPESIRWLTAESSGRVEEVAIQAGAAVEPDTLVVRLENLDLRLMTVQADRDARAADARLLAHQRQSRRERLDLADELTSLRSSHAEAQRRAQAYEQMEGSIVSRLDRQALSDRVLELERRVALGEQRLALLDELAPRELAALRLELTELARIRQVRGDLVEQLSVRALGHGILQDVLVELGQWVVPGTPVAKVIINRKLQAELRIAAEQAGSLALGQAAVIQAGFGDAQRSTLSGRVRRVHPAASEGTVAVEVALDGPPPDSIRPDQNVDGSVEVERVESTLYVARPVGLGGSGHVSLFRLDQAANAAHRVSVRIGRVSIDSIEILDGLGAGDEIVVSDMSRHSGIDALILE